MRRMVKREFMEGGSEHEKSRLKELPGSYIVFLCRSMDVFQNFLFQKFNSLRFRECCNDFPFPEDRRFSITACEPDICMTGFSGTVYNASHDSDF